MVSSAQRPHVIILAERALPRMAWSALLEQLPGVEMWGVAANLQDVKALSPVDGPLCLLLDFPQPALSLVEEMTSTVPAYGLLCLVDDYNLEDIVSLLQAGATGCLTRDATVPELSRALIAAARGEIVLPPTLAAQALAALARGEVRRGSDVETLTDRERDVLSLLSQGMTNKDIAQSLFLSVRTVEAHLRNIYAKLDIGSRTEAVLWAVQHGFDT